MFLVAYALDISMATGVQIHSCMKVKVKDQLPKIYIFPLSFNRFVFKLGQNDLTMQLGRYAQVRRHLLQGQGHSESKTQREIVRTA